MGVSEGIGWVSYTGADAQAAFAQYKSQMSPNDHNENQVDDPDDPKKKSMSRLGQSFINSTGQYALPGMKVPYPVNFKTGLPIKPPIKR